jgi:predicted O-linked N-acetylglucosamine transferase (SPINDLY family)
MAIDVKRQQEGTVIEAARQPEPAPALKDIAAPASANGASPHAEGGLRGEPANALADEFVATMAVLASQGMSQEVEALARQMTALWPGHGLGWKALADALLRQGRTGQALEPLSKAAQLLPEDAGIAHHLRMATALHHAIQHHESGELDDAEAGYRAVLAAQPNHADANYNLGVLESQRGHPQQALPYFETALGSAPNQLQYWASYVNSLHWAGQTKAAWLALEMGQQRGLRGPAVDALIVLMSHPGMLAATPSVNAGPKAAVAPAVPTQPARAGNAPAGTARRQRGQPARQPEHAAPTAREMNEALAFFNRGRIEQAVKAARRLVERYPSHALGFKVLGCALHAMGRFNEALGYLQTAHEQLPEDLESIQVIADILRTQGRPSDAEKAIRRLLDIKPDHGEAQRILGMVLRSQGRYAQAEAASRRALELLPGNALASTSLGFILLEQGQLAEAERYFRRALEIDPYGDVVHNNLLFCLSHSEDIDTEDLAAQHRQFGERFEASLRDTWQPHPNPREPNRRLHIGLVSGDLLNHAVANFLEPISQHLSRDESLTLHAYSNHTVEDNVTERLRQHFAHWNPVFGLSDEALARKIRADRIDILIDLSGHTARNRLLCFARKPAPVQASWMGYPGTTGLAAMDYYISDRFVVPPELDRQFREKIARLPASAPFLPFDSAPPVNTLPALHHGYLTFGSFNRLNKLRPDVIALWARLLHALPHARMLIGAMPEDESGHDVLQWFARAGIGRERIELKRRATVPVYLQQHHHVDICLDTFPYAGGTTTRHALWMGVPTLTMPGQRIASRTGASALAHVGLDGFTARDAQDFLQKGQYWASHLDELAALRAGMRARCMASPLFRPELLANGVSHALRLMWRRWCEGMEPASFDLRLDGEQVVEWGVERIVE